MPAEAVVNTQEPTMLFYAAEHRSSMAKGLRRTSVHAFPDAMSMDDWIQGAQSKRGVQRTAYGQLRSPNIALYQAHQDPRASHATVTYHSFTPGVKTKENMKDSDFKTTFVNVPVPKRYRGQDALDITIDERGNEIFLVQLPRRIAPVEVTMGSKWRPESKTMDISGGVFTREMPRGKHANSKDLWQSIRDGESKGRRAGYIKDMEQEAYYEVGFPSSDSSGKPWRVKIVVPDKKAPDGSRTVLVDVTTLQAAMVEHCFMVMEEKQERVQSRQEVQPVQDQVQKQVQKPDIMYPHPSDLREAATGVVRYDAAGLSVEFTDRGFGWLCRISSPELADNPIPTIMAHDYADAYEKGFAAISERITCSIGNPSTETTPFATLDELKETKVAITPPKNEMDLGVPFDDSVVVSPAKPMSIPAVKR